MRGLTFEVTEKCPQCFDMCTGESSSDSPRTYNSGCRPRQLADACAARVSSLLHCCHNRCTKEMEGLVPYASSSESCLARAAAPAAVKSSCRDTDRRKHNAFDGGAWQLQLVSLDRHTSTQLIREDRCIRKRELPTTWAIRRLSTHSLWRTSIPASVH